MEQTTILHYNGQGVECPNCGKVWPSYHQYGSHYQHCGEGKHPLIALVGEEKFKEEYTKYGSKILQSKYPCDDNTIVRAADKLGIKKQQGGEMGKSPPTTFMHTDGHIIWGVYDGDGDRYSYAVHRLLAVAEFGIEAVKGKVIHHKNGIPWDNRPSNIEPMTRKEHRTLHGLEQ